MINNIKELINYLWVEGFSEGFREEFKDKLQGKGK